MSNLFKKIGLIGLAVALYALPAKAEDGVNNLNTNQVSVTSSATLVAAARPGRQSATVENTGTNPLYCGSNASVTTGTGMLLPGILGAAVTFETSASIYCIGVSTQIVSYMEVF